MKRILVIEDTADVRENLGEILELSGYQVISAEHGKMGVEMAIKEQPDAILCDIMMPELDGYGVLHILSRNQRTADIPFIFLTAKSEKEDFRKGMTLGADDYITKPFDDIELLDTLERRLNKVDRLRRTVQNGPERSLEKLIDEAKAQQQIYQLQDHRETRGYQKKDIVYHEGEHARWLFYVVSGEIKRYKINDDGRELITGIARPGDFFGFTALITETTYNEYAAAVEYSEIRLVPREDFVALLFGNKEVSIHFIKQLAANVDNLERSLLDMAYSSVRKKVAHALLLLTNNGSLPVNWLRDDLAALAGTAKETLIRTLTDFRNEKLIQIQDGVLSLLQPEKLRNMPY